MKINKKILLILRIYLLAISIFLVFRAILFITEIDLVGDASVFTVILSFVMGVRFDIVISGYILLLPALVFMIQDIVGAKDGAIKRIMFYWIFVFFTIAFLISTADIPYFNQFYDRFSVGAFEWIESSGIIVSMIIEEPKYFLIIIPFIIIEIVFYVLLKKIFNIENKNSNRLNIYYNIISSILFLFLMTVGIRGRIQQKSPIRIGTAYFSDNSFLNKLGLNPVFTLIRSYIESKNSRNAELDMIDKDVAVKNVQKYLNIQSTKYKSPIARDIIPDTISGTKPNIVLVIMESMSAAKMERHGNKNQLTPFLDSLADNSIYFENIYTSGKHTFNGVFSSLFSFPALYRRHPMKQIKKYDGLSSSLVKNGYSTTYFTTHDGQFDNIEGFLRANDFQDIISQSDYPMDEIKTSLGVPDDYMFRYSMDKINELHKKDKPFFVTFMTVSDHGPYYIPDYFNPRSKKIKQQIVEYADWSLKRFIAMSSKQEWFDNTVFVFVADHGAPLNAVYDISLNYFHTPLIIYAPSVFPAHKVYKEIGSQIDIYPTIMGLINQAYVNNTLGIDLLKEKRKYAIINDDDKIGIIDTTYFCIMKKNEEDLSLYKYRDKDKTNHFRNKREKAIDMAIYAKSNMQTYQEMMLKGETTLHR